MPYKTVEDAELHSIAKGSGTRSTLSPSKQVDEAIRSGADINSTDESGLTPLHKATALGHLETLKAFLQVKPKANVNAQDKSGNTPVHAAMGGAIANGKNFDPDTLVELIKGGADLTIKNKAGFTPLEEAKKAISILEAAPKHPKTTESIRSLRSAIHTLENADEIKKTASLDDRINEGIAKLAAAGRTLDNPSGTPDGISSEYGAKSGGVVLQQKGLSV